MDDLKYILPDEWYTVLKWLGLVAIPAFAVFYGTIAQAWGWPKADEVVLTLNALGTLIGVLIGYSQITAEKRAKDDQR